MRPPIFVGSLSKEEVTALEAYYREVRDADERTRCQIILPSYEGLTPPAIAKIVRWKLRSVHRAIRRYQRRGLAGPKDGRHGHPGRKCTVSPHWEAKLLEVLDQDPRQFGIDRATWTAQLLADYLAQETGIRVGEERVRHYFHHHDYAPRRPTWTVAHKAREAPEYEAKRGGRGHSGASARRCRCLRSRRSRTGPPPNLDSHGDEAWSGPTA